MTDMQTSEFPGIIPGGGDLAAFLNANKSAVDAALADAGALLFRGFDVPDPLAFDAAIEGYGETGFTYEDSLSNAVRTNVTPRVFTAGDLPEIVEFKAHKLGIMICEDMWHADVAAHLAAQGAQILIVPNGSPWRIGKEAIREKHASARATETALPLLYVNQIGGQDELVFDGGSFVMDARGDVILRAGQFTEDTILFCHPERSGAQSRDLTLKNIYNILRLRAKALRSG